MAIRLTTAEPPSASDTDTLELDVTGTDVWRPCRAKKAAALEAGWSGRRADDDGDETLERSASSSMDMEEMATNPQTRTVLVNINMYELKVRLRRLQETVVLG